jgi:type I restriction enzyme S subunit
MTETSLGELSMDGGRYGIAASAVDYTPDLPAYLRITDIRDDGTLDLSSRKSVEDPNATDYMLEPNDIVFARTGNSTGRNYFYDPRDGRFAYAGFLIKFSLNPAEVNPRYIKYYAQSKPYWDWVASFNTGSTRGNINAKTYASMPITLPSRCTQDGIVRFCDAISDKIRVNGQINGYLFDLAATQFNEALRHGSEEVKLSRIVKFEDSKRIPLNSRDRACRQGPFPYYGAASVMDYVDDYIFDGPRILLGEDGTVVTSDGHPVLQYVWGKYWVNNHAHVLRPSGAYSLESIYMALSMASASRLVTGAVQPKINQRNLGNLSVLMPAPDSLGFLKPIFSSYRTRIEENRRLDNLRDSLLPKLMSGEIDVSKVEVPTPPNSHLCARRLKASRV